jgi:hypothetical protein
MYYLLYTLTFLVLVGGTALYVTRSSWLHRVPSRTYLYSRLPSTFAGDVAVGLSSDTFDLSGNVESADGRAGLDDGAKAEILRIMKKRRLTFDNARKVYMEQRFSDNDIAADGRPRDPKFVSFS